MLFVKEGKEGKGKMKEKVKEKMKVDKEKMKVDVKSFTLKNGLRVYLIPKNDGSGVSGVFFWVGSGSADEPPEFFGGAHLLEHMIFKGSEQRRVGEVADAVERVGGYINAWTSFDETTYWAVVPSEKITTPIQVFKDVIWNPKIDEKEFNIEREVVLEEYRRGEDIPQYRIYKKFFELLYKGSEYGHPVIGYEEVLKSITPELTRKFHQKFYSPKNTFLIISGDFDEKEITKLVKKELEKVATKDMVKKKKYGKPKFEGPELIIESGKEKEAILVLGFLGDYFDIRKVAAYDIIADILETRLTEKLRIMSPLANSVDVDYWSAKGIGSLIIHIELDGKNIEEVLKEVSSEIRKIKLGVKEKELEDAKNSILKGFYSSLQSAEGIARTYGNIVNITQNPEYVEKYIEEVEKMSLEDLENYFEIFSEKRVGGAIYVNDEDKANIKTDLKSLLSFEAQKIEMKREKGKLAEKYENGIKVILKEIKGTGTVSMHALMKGGVVADGEKVGISNFATRAILRGTKTRTAKAILDEIGEIGGSISSSSGAETISLSASFLSRKIEKGFDIFFDVLFNPTFPEEEVEKVRKDILEDLKTRYDNPQVQAMDEFAKAIFPQNHPYYYPEKARKEIIEKITAEELKEFWEKTIGGDIIISIVGDFNKEKVLKILQLYIGERKKGGITIPEPEIKYEEPKEKRIKREGNQAHILIGFPGVDIKSEDYFKMRVINAALSGQGGRIFMELREKKGLAYVAAPVMNSGIYGGYIGGYIACHPQKMTEAIEGMKKIFQNLELSEEEIERGKNLILGGLKRGLQTNSQWAEKLAEYEFLFGFDYIEKIPKIIKSIKKKDIDETIKKYYSKKETTLILE